MAAQSIKDIPSMLAGAKATEVRRNELHAQVQAIMNKVGFIEGKWTSPASADFQQIMADWKRMADHLLQQLDDIAINLRRAAGLHERTEQEEVDRMKRAAAAAATSRFNVLGS